MTLRERYIIARWSYACGEEYISDAEYNRIHRELSEMLPDDEYVNRPWSADECPVELLVREGMASLCKKVTLSHSSESMYSITSETEYRDSFYRLDRRTRVSYKEDGWNASVDYYNGIRISAQTRGRGGNAMESQTLLELVPERIPLMGKVKVYGECVIPNSKWKLYELETGNKSQRNSVSTAIANGDVDYLQLSAFTFACDTDIVCQDKYELLKSWGFNTPQSVIVYNFEQLEKAIDLLCKRKVVYPRPTDGLVVENDVTQVAVRIRAYAEEELQSYVVDYIQNYGLYGVAMVCKISPVNIQGATHDKVSVTNLSYITGCNLKKGQPIAFSIRSAVNAALDVTRTEELQRKWGDNLEEYQAVVDDKFSNSNKRK